MPSREPLDVGHEEVVADQLDALAQALGEQPPAVPVVLGHAVLERDDRVAAAQVLPAADELLGASSTRPSPTGGSAVAVELRHGRVERDADGRRLVAGALGGLEDELDRVLVPRRSRARSRPRRRRRSRARARAGAPSARGRPRRRCAAPRRSSPRRTGTSMNSCRSIELSACAPPLTTFIIGTGRTCGVGPADVAVQAEPELVGGRPGHGERRRRGARSPRARPLLAVPSSSHSSASIARWSCEVAADQRGGELVVHVAHAPAARPCPRRRRRRRAARPPRGAGRGARGHGGATAARRTRVTTSTSTVGLPRESRIWRAWTDGDRRRHCRASLQRRAWRA